MFLSEKQESLRQRHKVFVFKREIRACLPVRSLLLSVTQLVLDNLVQRLRSAYHSTFHS